MQKELFTLWKEDNIRKDQIDAVIAPLYNEKGVKDECIIYSIISLQAG